MTVKIATLIPRKLVKPIVLAGGYGGRLNALSDPERNRYPIAKAVAAIGAKRSIDFSLDAIKKLGIKQAELTVWHLPHTIEQLVRSTTDFQIGYNKERQQDPLDTAGTVISIVKEQGWDSVKQNVILVQSSDIVHNIPLELVLEAHLKNRAAATIVLNPVSWDQIHHFGTVRLEGMPRRSRFKSEIEFEDAVGTWVIDNQGASARILEFREKSPRFDPDPAKSCLSNLNNSSIYIFNAELMRALTTMMTKKGKNEPLFPDLYKSGGPAPFSDWGRHIFQWLTAKKNRERFPFYGFVIPDRFYWKDIGIGEDIRQANMDVLEGDIDGSLGGFKKEDWGWRGNNVFIDPSARITRSLVADNSIIGPGARLDEAVIRENTVVEDNAHIYRSVVFPRPYERREPNRIGKGVRLIECLFLGGEILPNFRYERKMVYSPIGGAAIDSLFDKVDIP